MNLYTICKYLNYKLFSSHSKGHGIHSPFLFNLVTKIFRNKPGRDVVLNIEGIRRRMLSDDRILNVTDLGSGGERGCVSRRKVHDIVRRSAIPCKYGSLLTNLAREYGKNCVIEMGTSLGIGTMFLASGSRYARVHTIEGCGETVAVASENFRIGGFENIVIYHDSFNHALSELRETGVIPGLVFIDGDHRKKSVLDYFEVLYRMADNETVLVFDDIHSTHEMGEAWNDIVRDPRVTLTVDVFRMGLVFFRQGLTPASVVIRY